MDSSPQSNHYILSVINTSIVIETVIPKKSLIQKINSFIIRVGFSKVEDEINRNRSPQDKITIDFTHLYHVHKATSISKCPGSFRTKLSNFYKKLDAFLYGFLNL